jgi:RNA polymerase sigma-70 factor, ECF subfamily
MPKVDGSATDVIMLLRLACAPPDRSAWEAFFKRYGPRIRAWCRAWRLQEADAQDVTQAVLIKLVLSLRQFTYDPSQSFRGWLENVGKACLFGLHDRS